MNLVTAIGLLAATLTTISFIPQAVKIIRTKHTKDISLWMYICLLVGLVCWLIYGIMLMEVPIILANSVTFVFVAAILVMKIKYK